MNLTAATITIYFIGLVNFNSLGTGAGYEALVPAASIEREFAGVKLQRHRAKLVISNWAHAAAATGGCAALGGTVSGSSTCIVSSVEGGGAIEIASSGPFDDTGDFRNIPHLQPLCSSLGARDPAFELAAQMKITHGKLDASVSGRAWTAILTADVAERDNFKFGGRQVTLPSGAIVRISNEPIGMDSTTQEQHFFWYFLMRQNATGCRLPSAPGEPAPVVLPASMRSELHRHGGEPTTTGVGCSVTQYP